MNKSGQIERLWLWTFYLVLVAIAVGGFVFYLETGVSDDAFMQEFYLNDITFLVNKIVSSEFDEVYIYEIPVGFSVEITSDEVKVGLSGKTKSKEYIENKNYKIVYERMMDKLILKRK